jgi:hypothetical protein
MRQLRGLPATIADTLARVELRKAEITAFQKLGREPVSIFGVLQFGKYACALFVRKEDNWEVTICQPGNSQQIKPYLLGLGFIVCNRPAFDHDTTVVTQEDLNKLTTALRSFYRGVGGNGASLHDAATRLLSERGLDDPLPVPAPSSKLELVQLEIGAVRACAKLSGYHPRICEHHLEAIHIAEAALDSRDGLSSAERHALSAQVHSMRIGLQEFCAQQVARCEEDGVRAHGRGGSLESLAELEWWLTQRLAAMPHAWRKKKQSIQARCEVARTELFGEYRALHTFRAAQVTEWLEECNGNQSALEEKRVMIDGASQVLSLTAGRLAQVCTRLKLRDAAAEWQWRSDSTLQSLGHNISQLVKSKLEAPYGID